MAEPDAHHFINDLALALHGKEMHARPVAPEVVWKELLAEVREYSGVDRISTCSHCGKAVDRNNSLRRWLHSFTSRPECEPNLATPLTSTSQHNDSHKGNDEAR